MLLQDFSLRSDDFVQPKFFFLNVNQECEIILQTSKSISRFKYGIARVIRNER